jgi:large subunit ribosomal protein L9
MAEAILLKDVDGLGEAGSVVEVSPGYLRNYLAPRKLAQNRHAGVDRGRPAAARAGRDRGARAGGALAGDRLAPVQDGVDDLPPRR